MTEPLPEGPFSCILADPPWSYSVFSAKGEGRSAKQHYDVMTMADIAALPVADVAAKNAHLFMWCTGPNIVRGDHVGIMRAWGFEPSAMAFVWIKSKRRYGDQGILCGFVNEDLFAKGMGHTTRQNAEYVLLGRRGSPKRLDKSIHQIIVAPRRGHSRKPDEQYERIERYAAGPYLELFARQARPGWTAWGNQTGKFTAEPMEAAE